jgi:hypothetical protein
MTSEEKEAIRIIMRQVMYLTDEINIMKGLKDVTKDSDLFEASVEENLDLDHFE